MKIKNYLIFWLLLLKGTILLNAQEIHYTYNTRIEIKQGNPLSALKNPFVGGFQLPQFSAIDLNMDFTNDLLVFDRGTKKFYTFINDRIPNTVSYTYAPQYEYKFPSCQNFCLTYDYNNDGRMDLYIEANGFIEQYRNITTFFSLKFK